MCAVIDQTSAKYITWSDAFILSCYILGSTWSCNFDICCKICVLNCHRSWERKHCHKYIVKQGSGMLLKETRGSWLCLNSCLMALNSRDLTSQHYWSTLLVNTTGSHYWSALLTHITGPHYWSTILVHITDQQYWSILLAHITDPLYWSIILVHYIGLQYWSTILVYTTSLYYWSHRLPNKLKPWGSLVIHILIFTLWSALHEKWQNV